MPKQSLGFVSLAPRGDWDANTTYKRLDTVNYGGSSYIVLKALTGVTPVGDNINYMLLASKGDNAFQVWLLQPGNEGKTYEDYEAWLRQPATDAGERADEAAGKAQGAADNANSAATAAQGATQNANAAAEEARTNAASAKNEADAAREAATNANNAATTAQGAAQNANTAADKANEAAGTIDDKIGLMGRIIESTVENIDDTPGFWSSGFSPETKGTKPTSAGYGTVCQFSNTINSPMTGGQTWVFQFAHLHGVDRPYWRRQYNNMGWSDWKQVALMNDIPAPSFLMKRNNSTEIQADAILGTSQYGFGYENRGFPTSGSFISFGGFSDDYTTQIIAAYKGDKIYFRTYDGDLKKWNTWQRLARYNEVLLNSGEQTLSNGRLNMLVSAPEHVLMFKDAAGNIGYIGFGAFPTKDLQIMNYATGKYISISADGKLYYDNKELAFKSDIGSGGDNWYPTVMNWTDGSVQGPRLNLSGVGMTALSATIPIAGVSVSGVVTTTDQVFAGRKSFAAGIDIIAGGMAVDGGIAVSNGTIVCSGEVSAAYFFCTDEVVAASFFGESDVRLKKNISPINLTEKGRIRLCEFDKSGRHSYGVIAQEVEKLYPTAVKENHGRKVVNYIEILTIKCAEQDERIEVLERENACLKERLERLEKLLLK